jgi:hypothetical protein
MPAADRNLLFGILALQMDFASRDQLVAAMHAWVMRHVVARLREHNLAFLAMARHQLGQKGQARETLRRLREVMRQPRWANDAGRQGFLREAEELLQAKGKDPQK